MSLKDKLNNKNQEMRMNDIPKPIVIGHSEASEEEMEERKKKSIEILRSFGILGENENIDDRFTRIY
ncbi:MAG: hypothetical protein Q4C49_05305 [Bacillota bacterium]|nr:hypothetical protein [Bacillota bacterium]